MTIKKGQILEVVISNVVYGGRGLAKISNFTIFVDYAITGDIVEVRIIKKRKNYAEARILKFLQLSSYRVKTPCEYSGICGGCKWQFLDYKQQLLYKQQHVLESLKHIAFLDNINVNPTIPSDNIFGYRNKMEFSCSDKRWLLPSELGKDVESWFGLGLHVPGVFYKVIDLSYCLLQPDLGNEIFNDVKLFMKSSNSPPYGLKSHEGFWRFLVIRNSLAYNHWMINLVVSNNDKKNIQPLVKILENKYNNISSIVMTVNSSKAGVATGEDKINLWGSNTIREKINGYDFDISSNSFFQTNTMNASKLCDVIKNYSDLSNKDSLLDLYCGAGMIAICLSGIAKKVKGIEFVESAVRDAKNNCKLNRVTNCDFILGDVKEELSKINNIPDVIIVDPPRMGMHSKVRDKIIDMAPNRLIYVSCNPVTFARDMLILKKLYEIEVVQPIDMFPHTFHVEMVAKLNKRKKIL